MVSSLILTPPLAFIIVLAAVIIISSLFSRLSYKAKPDEEASTKAYACGEDVPTSMIQPDYSAFFPFAFLFTILHVVALVVATVPLQTAGSFAMAILYVAGAVTALFILFRR
jgi:hypothetical protein